MMLGTRKILSLLFLLALTAMPFTGNAQGRFNSSGIGSDQVKEIRINGLDHYRGLMMTAFYVNTRRPGFGTAGSRPQVKQVLKKSRAFPINGNGQSIVIPATSVPRKGIYAFNHVVLVVHSPYLDRVGIRNLNSTIPRGQEEVLTQDILRNIKEEDSNNPFNHRQDFFVSKYRLRGSYDKSFVELTLTPIIIPGVR